MRSASGAAVLAAAAALASLAACGGSSPSARNGVLAPPPPPPSQEEIRANKRNHLREQIEENKREERREIDQVTQGKPESEWTEEMREEIVQIKNMFAGARERKRVEMEKYL